MKETDQAARDLGISRSGLVSEALREYLRKRRHATISEQLNQVYSRPPTPAEQRLVRSLRKKVAVPNQW